MSPEDRTPEGNVSSLEKRRSKAVIAAKKARYGDRIRERRVACGLSQPQLAKVLGVAKNTICNWEKGYARPDINQLAMLCETLKTTVTWFLGIPGQLGDLSAEERRHLANYRFLSESNRQAVDSLIDAMLEIADRELYARCEQGFERIRRNGNKTAAGLYGSNLDDESGGEYVYVRSSRNACLADEIITVSGDSMEPTFRDGDDLLVEHAEELRPGEIGIFVADGVGYVKEYRRDGLHSHNPAYPVLRFSEDDGVRCVGRVLGVVAADQYATRTERNVLEEIRQEKRKGK